MTTVGWILAAFAAAAIAALLAFAVISIRVKRRVGRISAAIGRIGHGDLRVDLSPEGSGQLGALARTVNVMAEAVAARLAAMERDRATRDAILAALEEGIVLFGSDGEALYQNDSARRLLGPVASIRSLVPSELRELVAGTGTGGGPSSSVEVETGAAPTVLQATAVAIPGQGELLMVVRDVTRARVLDAVRRDFVANASHELKTPVASIRALADTISTAAPDDPASIAPFAAQLERETLRLSRIMSDLLDLSRLEGRPAGRTQVRLDRLVAEEAGRYADRASEAGLRLAVDAGQAVTVAGSSEDLRLLVRNLVENAIQYTRPGGEVQVAVRSAEGGAMLTVRDTGIGIPAKDQARVFERFYRVDRARSRETGGTGLGLSIVRHVAENHGGTVSVASRLGRGTTFLVKLPAA